jgi:hypothetical protein
MGAGAGPMFQGVGPDCTATEGLLGELKIPVTVDAYGNGTHHELYFDREFQRSLPLILKALGL